MTNRYKMVFYLDGDNLPTSGINGIRMLDPTDEVHIFYASNNQYFNEVKRNNIGQVAKCVVTYSAITKAPNAVDFAIAVELAKRCAKPKQTELEEIYMVVSGDNHFDVIVSEVKRSFGRELVVNRVTSIEEGYSRYFWVKVDNLQMLHESLQRQLGTEMGQHVYGKLKRMFVEDAKQTKLALRAEQQKAAKLRKVEESQAAAESKQPETKVAVAGKAEAEAKKDAPAKKAEQAAKAQAAQKAEQEAKAAAARKVEQAAQAAAARQTEKAAKVAAAGQKQQAAQAMQTVAVGQKAQGTQRVIIERQDLPPTAEAKGQTEEPTRRQEPKLKIVKETETAPQTQKTGQAVTPQSKPQARQARQTAPQETLQRQSPQHNRKRRTTLNLARALLLGVTKKKA